MPATALHHQLPDHVRAKKLDIVALGECVLERSLQPQLSSGQLAQQIVATGLVVADTTIRRRSGFFV